MFTVFNFLTISIIASFPRRSQDKGTDERKNPVVVDLHYQYQTIIEMPEMASYHEWHIAPALHALMQGSAGLSADGLQGLHSYLSLVLFDPATDATDPCLVGS
jgi:hypothetical protein